jgi:hypothetical protein
MEVFMTEKELAEYWGAQRRPMQGYPECSFCSLAIECGVDPCTLKFLVNHATNGGSDVTARPTIPSFEHRAAAARKIAAHIEAIVGSVNRVGIVAEA